MLVATEALALAVLVYFVLKYTASVAKMKGAEMQPQSSFHKGSQSFKFEEDVDDMCLPFAFDLPLDHLVMVDCDKALKELQLRLADATLLGIDTETQPGEWINFERVEHPTSTIQIAIRAHDSDEYVFLVDMLTLSKSPVLMQELDIVLTAAFSSDSITTIGHELRQDIAQLHRHYPEMTCFRSISRVLELNTMHRYIHAKDSSSIHSLKHFARVYLHSNLVKTQQCSNWGLRPLSAAQIIYAACDCLILLRLYDVMCYEAEEVHETVDISSLLVEVVHGRSSPRKRSREHVYSLENSSSKISRRESDS